MLRSKGSSLIDYILPTAIVGIILGLSLYTLYSSGSLGGFMSASMDMKVDMNNGVAVIGEHSLLSKSLGGTEAAPVKQCSFGVCIIDGGKLILTNIPDSSSFIETAGSAGGTKKMADLISQIAGQIIDDPTTPEDEQKDLQTLANLGHFIAAYEQKIEDVIKDCNAQSDPKTCMQSNFWTGKTPISIDLPDNLKDVLTDYSQSSTNFGTQSNVFIDMGLAAKSCVKGTSCLSAKEPNDAFFYYYDKVMSSSSSSYSPAAKNSVTELFQDIALLGYNMSLQIDNAAGGAATGGGYDPLTGEFVSVTYPKINDLSEILHPKTSVGSNLDSAIMCAVGGKPDDGYSCK